MFSEARSTGSPGQEIVNQHCDHHRIRAGVFEQRDPSRICDLRGRRSSRGLRTVGFVDAAGDFVR